MNPSALLSRIALGAGGALILGATALGANASIRPPRLAAAAPAIRANRDNHHTRLSGVGPADSRLRVVNLAQMARDCIY